MRRKIFSKTRYEIKGEVSKDFKTAVINMCKDLQKYKNTMGREMGNMEKLNGNSRDKNIISKMKVLHGGSDSIYTVQN